MPVGFALNVGLISMNVLPPNFTFNYASVFAIVSLSIIIVAAIASSIYPATLASRMITPSLERKWKPATKPKGEEWEVTLPISLPTLDESMGFIEYLNEYYEGIGAQKPMFTIRQIMTVSTTEPGIELLVALSPYEMTITQSVKIHSFVIQKEQHFGFNVYMRKLTGPTNVWAVTSYYFVDDLRKQALLWRSLTAEEHRRYIERALSRTLKN